MTTIEIAICVLVGLSLALQLTGLAFAVRGYRAVISEAERGRVHAEALRKLAEEQRERVSAKLRRHDEPQIPRGDELLRVLHERAKRR